MRRCGASSTEFDSSVGGACSTVSPGGDRAGPARWSSTLRSEVRAQEATVRDQLDGARLFGRRCVLDRQPGRRPCGTSSTEFNSSVVGAVSTVGDADTRGRLR